MGTLGMQEMIVIFVLALVLFGPKKLPELGRTIGKAITEFRRASNDLKASFEREMQTLERESQSMSQVAQVTASDIFNRAVNYDPEPEVRSLPPAETIWNPLEPHNGDHLITGPQTPAPPGGPTRIDRGAVTERTVAAAAKAGGRLVLGPRAVLTPLAREKARALGIEIEREGQ